MTARIALGALALALAGCTNDWPVTARTASGVLEFVAKDGPADAACAGSIRVGRAREETMWEIRALNPDRTDRPCATRLPLRYGAAPPGFDVIVPARPLVAGTTYDLTGSGKRFLRGAFRYRGPAAQPVNFKPNSAEWCEAQYPGTHPDWTGQCVS